MPAAAELKARLLGRLSARLPELSALGQEGRGLLVGAPRTWLPCRGLR
ncbi:hypothetical protein [Streptomyces sp. MUSC 14]|nr:hypothetical protein [Streptomyces sp. MUSC 14]